MSDQLPDGYVIDGAAQVQQPQIQLPLGYQVDPDRPDAMGPLSVPQTEVGYLLNSVNHVPGINMLKEAGAGIRGGVAAATGGDFTTEYNNSRANQNKLMYNQAQQQPDFHGVTPNGVGSVGAGLLSAGILPTAGATGSILGDATIGSMEGGGYGALSGFGNGGSLDDRLNNAVSGGTLGAAFGGSAGLTAGGVGSLTGAYRGLYPAAKLSAAQDALDLGIPVYKSNLSDSKAMDYLASGANELPGVIGGTGSRVTGQQQAMAQALNKSMGTTGNELTQEGQQQAMAATGKAIGDINAKYSIPFKVQVNNDLATLQAQAKQQLTGDNLKLFNQQITKIKSDAKANGGQLPGGIYQQTRSGLNEDIMSNSGGSSARYGRMLQNLRDTLDMHFAAAASPQDAAALQTLRQQYGNAKDIQPVTDMKPLGDYSMARLQSALTGNQQLEPYGRVGQLFKNMTGNSGTAQRELLQKIGGGVAAVGSGVAGFHALDPDWGDDAMYLAGAAAGPGLANRALNPRVTNYSLNGVQGLQSVSPQLKAIANALRQAPAAVPLALSFQNPNGGQ